MFVWGGKLGNSYLGTGARYNPSNDAWSPLSISGAPSPRGNSTAVWTGNEVLVFGGQNATSIFGELYTYTPPRVMYLYLHP
jgi:N-acetylneuraminic acid mutarotase